eukprot:jgi/Psemu1/55804/gm1.55804_g
MAKKGHTQVGEILPVGPEEWAQVTQIHKDNFPNTHRSVQNLCRKYGHLYLKKVPTDDPNFPEEVKLAKRVKWLIKGKQGVGDGEEHYNMVEGYQNDMEDEEYISSEEDDDDSDDDNILPPIPLSNRANGANAANGADTANGANAASTASTANPANLANPAANPAYTTAASSIFPTNPRTRTQYTNHHKCTSKNCSTLLQFVSSSLSPSSTLRSKRQYHRNTNGRHDILDFLRENSKLEREQRREDHQLEREHREAAFQAQRQQTEAALESLKADIVDVATILLNGLPIPLKALVPV